MEYRVEVRAAGLFPAVAQAVCTSGQTTVMAIELRRLTDVDVRVLAADGSPVAGTLPVMVDEATSTDVMTWVEQGLVTIGGEATDAAGWIHYRGLAEGRYRLAAAGIESVAEAIAGSEPTIVVLRRR